MRRGRGVFIAMHARQPTCGNLAAGRWTFARPGHYSLPLLTMDVLSPFIAVLCHSD